MKVLVTGVSLKIYNQHLQPKLPSEHYYEFWDHREVRPRGGQFDLILFCVACAAHNTDEKLRSRYGSTPIIRVHSSGVSTIVKALNEYLNKNNVPQASG